MDSCLYATHSRRKAVNLQSSSEESRGKGGSLVDSSQFLRGHRDLQRLRDIGRGTEGGVGGIKHMTEA